MSCRPLGRIDTILLTGTILNSFALALGITFLVVLLVATAHASVDRLQESNRARAEGIFSEAERLYEQGTSESLLKSIHKYEEALTLWRSISDRVGEGNTLDKIGQVYNDLGEKEKALDFYNQALSVRRLLSDQKGEGNTLTRIGSVYDDLGEKQKALTYYHQALPLNRATGDRLGEADTLQGMAVVYDILGETQKALTFYNLALPLVRTVGERRGEAYTLAGIGKIVGDLGEKQEALTYFNQVLSIVRAIGDRSGEAYALTSIGSMYDDLGEKQKALSFFDQSLSIRHNTGDRIGEANTLNNIGTVYVDLGEPQKALNYYNEALRLVRAVNYRHGEALTLINIAFSYNSLGEREQSLNYYNQALDLVRAVGDRRGEAMALYNMAHLERDSGNLAKAQSEITSALSIVESLRGKIARPDLRTSYGGTIHGYYGFYVDLLMQLHKQQPSQRYDQKALQVNERGRARSLLELLTESGTDIRQGIDAGLLQRERSSQQKLNASAQRQAQLLNGKHTDEQAEAAAREIEALTREYQQVQIEIRGQSPRYASLTQPQPLEIEEIQRLLDVDTVLLEYSLGDGASYLWAVTRSSIASYELPKRAEIDKAARRVYDLLIARNMQVRFETGEQKTKRVAKADAEYPTAAAALSKVVLGPVAGTLGRKRLVIVSDGALQYIPFGALPVPRAQKRQNSIGLWLNGKEMPLVAEHEIVSLPSASTLAVLRQDLGKRKLATKSVAVLADPVFDKDDERVKSNTVEKTGRSSARCDGTSDTGRRIKENLRGSSAIENRIPRLLCTRQEAKEILAIARPNSAMAALDFKASLATAAGAALSRYQIVHFATHGWLDSENPELSAVILSLVDEKGNPQDGFLRLNEIYNLNLSADLVVLSACETGLGKDIRGEGLVGLTRGFMYAGATRVVVSLWEVNDVATAELMRRFYKGVLKKRLQPSAALKAAQLAMLRDRRWQAPYYWAAFISQGEWN